MNNKALVVIDIQNDITRHYQYKREANQIEKIVWMAIERVIHQKGNSNAV